MAFVCGRWLCGEVACGEEGFTKNGALTFERESLGLTRVIWCGVACRPRGLTIRDRGQRGPDLGWLGPGQELAKGVPGRGLCEWVWALWGAGPGWGVVPVGSMGGPSAARGARARGPHMGCRGRWGRFVCGRWLCVGAVCREVGLWKNAT